MERLIFWKVVMYLNNSIPVEFWKVSVVVKYG